MPPKREGRRAERKRPRPSGPPPPRPRPVRARGGRRQWVRLCTLVNDKTWVPPARHFAAQVRRYDHLHISSSAAGAAHRATNFTTRFKSSRRNFCKKCVLSKRGAATVRACLCASCHALVCLLAPSEPGGRGETRSGGDASGVFRLSLSFLAILIRFGNAKSSEEEVFAARRVAARDRHRRAQILSFVRALDAFAARAGGAGGSAWAHWRSNLTGQKFCMDM